MSPGMRSTIIAIPVGPLPDAIPESMAEASEIVILSRVSETDSNKSRKHHYFTKQVGLRVDADEVGEGGEQVAGDRLDCEDVPEEKDRLPPCHSTPFVRDSELHGSQVGRGKVCGVPCRSASPAPMGMKMSDTAVMVLCRPADRRCVKSFTYAPAPQRRCVRGGAGSITRRGRGGSAHSLGNRGSATRPGRSCREEASAPRKP